MADFMYACIAGAFSAMADLRSSRRRIEDRRDKRDKRGKRDKRDKRDKDERAGTLAAELHDCLKLAKDRRAARRRLAPEASGRHGLPSRGVPRLPEEGVREAGERQDPERLADGTGQKDRNGRRIEKRPEVKPEREEGENPRGAQ